MLYCGSGEKENEWRNVPRLKTLTADLCFYRQSVVWGKEQGSFSTTGVPEVGNSFIFIPCSVNYGKPRRVNQLFWAVPVFMIEPRAF